MNSLTKHNNKYYDPLEACIAALKTTPKTRDLDTIKQITQYLKSLSQLMQVLEAESEFLAHKRNSIYLKEIAMRLTYENVPKNKMLMRYGDTGNTFYIILSGTLGFLTIKNQNYYLNEEEYIAHLIKLRKNNELELLKSCIHMNSTLIYIEDDFDQWLKDVFAIQRPMNAQNRKYSLKLLKYIEETIEWFKLKVTRFTGVNSKVTINEYVNATSLDYPSLPNDKRFLFTIFSYEHTNTYKGGTFGNVALEQRNQKRTATVITIEESHLAVLKKDDYDALLKEVNYKSRLKFFGLIYSYKIFNSIPKRTFENKYIHMFSFDKIERNKKVLVEGETCNYKTFIQKGEFELQANCNILELNQLLLKLKNKLKMNTATEEREIYELSINKGFRPAEHNKLLFDRKSVRVALIKDRDIIGLNDTIDLSNGFGLFTCISVSYKCEVFLIENQAFGTIIKGEYGVRDDNDSLVNDKINYYIDRLNQHKEMIMKLIQKNDNDNRNISTQMDKEKLIDRQLNKNRVCSFDMNVVSNKESLINMLTMNNAMNDRYNKKKKKKAINLTYTTDPNDNIKSSNGKLPYHKRMEKLMLLQQQNREFVQNLINEASKAKIDYNCGIHSESTEQSFEKEKKTIQRKTKYLITLDSYINKSKNLFNNKLLKSLPNEHMMNSNGITTRRTPYKSNIPTFYNSQTPKLLQSKVNYVDCLVMDRFNYYYGRSMGGLSPNK